MIEIRDTQKNKTERLRTMEVKQNPTLLNLNTVEKGERLSNSNSGLLIMMLTAHDNTKLKVIY